MERNWCVSNCMTNSKNSRGRLGTRPAARVRRERRHGRRTGARQKRPPGYRPSFTPPARSPGTGRSRRARSSSDARRRPTAAAPLKSVGAPVHSSAARTAAGWRSYSRGRRPRRVARRVSHEPLRRRKRARFAVLPVSHNDGVNAAIHDRRAAREAG